MDKCCVQVIMCGSNCIPFPQMPDGQIIQYEHDAAFLQEQQVRLIFIIESTLHLGKKRGEKELTLMKCDK